MKIELMQEIERIIQEKTILTKKEGFYRSEIFVDKYDELSDEEMIRISNSKEHTEEFYCVLDDRAYRAVEEHKQELEGLIREYWHKGKEDFIDNEEFVYSWIEDNVIFVFPYEHFTYKEIALDLIVDTGDGNYDYTLNNFIAYNAEDDFGKVDNESSILWLTKTQGYSKKQLEDACIDGNFSGRVFLESAVRECANVTTHMNALTFFIKMTLEEYIDYLDKHYDIKIPINVNCGLYDPWNGAGSLLGITLEKELVVPVEYTRLGLDGDFGYSVKEIWGLDDELWVRI